MGLEQGVRREVSAGPVVRPLLRTGEAVPLVALMMALSALSTDAMLPALPEIGSDLGVAERNDVQLVITALFLGIGFGPLLFGPLSDSIGRRRAICAGLALFMVGCVVSIVAPNFETMLVGRVLQGFGAAGPRVVSMALVRDQYEGRLMARIMSFVMAVFITVPMLAPAMGQGILLIADWRSIFAALFIVAGIAGLWLVLRQPETLPADRRLPFSPGAIARSTVEVLKTRKALGYTLATGFSFSPFIAYLSTAQQIFQDAYGVGLLFPIYFGGLAFSFGVAALVNGHLVMRYSMHRLSTLATIVVTVVSLTSWAAAFAFDGLLPLWMFIVTLLLVFGGVGLLFGNLNALALQSLGHIAGVGSAVIVLISTLISVPLGGLIGYSFDGTLYTLLGSFALSGAATFTAIRWATRGR